MLLQKNLEPADVVAVLMGKQDSVKRRGIDAHLLQTHRELFGAQAGIDHQTQSAALDDGRIAGAAASQDREPHHAARMSAAPKSRKLP